MDRAAALAVARTKGPGFLLEIGVNFVAPYLIYSWLSPSEGDVKALILSSLPPILWSIVEFVRSRRIDALSILVLGGIVLSLLAFLGGGGVRWLQLRRNLGTAVIGIAFLVSAAIGQPLIYLIAKAGMQRRGQDEQVAEFERLREHPGFRRTMTLMTVVWGATLVLEFAVSATLVFRLTIKQYFVVDPIVGYAILGAVSLWTFWYARRSRRSGEARRAAEAAANPPAGGRG